MSGWLVERFTLWGILDWMVIALARIVIARAIVAVWSVFVWITGMRRQRRSSPMPGCFWERGEPPSLLEATLIERFLVGGRLPCAWFAGSPASTKIDATIS